MIPEYAFVPDDTIDRLMSGRATEGDQMLAANALRYWNNKDRRRVEPTPAERSGEGEEMRTRYVIKEQAPMDTGTRVFRVLAHGRASGDFTSVWLSHGTARCTACSGPLSAMLSTCVHAKAVKRHLARNPT